jgi:protoporphyrinogen IX oxidase
MLWLKALHIIAMVAWFSGLFYLPRLFVYHAMSDDLISIARFKVMERKLYYGITTPSAILTAIFGFWMIALYPQAYFTMGWMHTKLLLVFVLFCYHIYCGRLLKHFAKDANQHSHVFYRWFNEFPVLLLAGIVILVVVKP